MLVQRMLHKSYRHQMTTESRFSYNVERGYKTVHEIKNAFSTHSWNQAIVG